MQQFLIKTRGGSMPKFFLFWGVAPFPIPILSLSSPIPYRFPPSFPAIPLEVGPLKYSLGVGNRILRILALISDIYGIIFTNFSDVCQEYG